MSGRRPRGLLDLEKVARDLAHADPAVVGRAVERLRPRLPHFKDADYRQAVEMICSLFYIDTQDRPDLEVCLDRAMDVLSAQGPRVIPALLDQMRGSDIKSHIYLARTLARMGDKALPSLRNLIATAEDPYARAFALYALGKMIGPHVALALPEVIGNLMHPDREVRDSAARTLGKIAAVVRPGRLTPRLRREMFETLLRATRDVQPAVRAKAMRSLGKMAAAGLLNGRQRRTLADAAQSAVGRSETYGWDNAYIVRREAEETLRNLTVPAWPPAGPAVRADATST